MEVQNDGSANELVYRTIKSTDDKVDLVEFGKRNDLEVHGDYDGDGRTDYAVARLQDSDYSWRIRFSSDGSKDNWTFGSSTHSVLGGCDIDGGGSSDSVTLTPKMKLLVRSSETTESSTTDLSVPSALSLVGLHCGDINSDGKDDVILILKRTSGKRRRSNIYAFSGDGTRLLKRRVKRVTKVVLADISGNGTLDIGGYNGKRKLKRKITFFDASGKLLNRLKFSQFKSVTTAITHNSDRSSEPTLLFLGKANSLFRFLLFENQEAQINRSLKGDHLLETPLGHVASSSDNPTTPSSCSSIMPASDGANGFLWKESEHGGLVVLFPQSFNQTFSSVVLLSGNTEVASLFFTGYANGDRQHWRHANSAASFPDNSVVKASGSNGSSCWQIGDSASRND